MMADSPEVWRAAVEALGDGVAVADAEGRLVYLNPVAARMFGVGAAADAGGVIDTPTIAVYAADGVTPLPREARPLRRAARGEASTDEEICVPGADGALVRLTVTARPLRDDAGVITGAVAVIRDVTARRAEQAQLANAHLFLDSIVEHIPDMIFVKDAEALRFELFNRAGEALLGLPRERLLGKSDYDLFPPDQAADFQARDREALRTGAIVEVPAEPIDTPRGRRWLHTKKIPLRGPDGAPRYLLGISSDVTERRAAEAALQEARDALARRVEERTEEARREARARATAEDALSATEQQLRQAQKMEAVGLLAGGIAHDFNNLLSVILGYSDLLARELSPRDPMREDLDQVRLAAERAADLTRQLLAFSRRQVLQPVVTDLNDVVRRTERMLRRVIGEDVVLVTSLAPALGRVLVDPGQVEQVLMNLAVNARDAMPRGGTLTLETANVVLDGSDTGVQLGSTPGPHVMLAVTDTGVGMDRATQARIFEPFFTTKPAGRGTGLGLATVYGVVKQSGGNLYVYSEPGQGTCFKVYFPRLPDSATRQPPARRPSSTRPAVRPRVVLLVEDDDLVRGAAKRILQRAGHTVLEARGGGEALLLSERFQGAIDLMVTDVVMPGMSGRELAERLAAARPAMRVLYVSGYTDDTIVRHGVLDVGVQYLQKPFTPASLTARVEEVLAEPEGVP